MKRTITLACLSVLAGLSSTNAIAGESHTDKTRVGVSFSDLDLNTLDGSAIALKRIENAAERACGGGNGRLSISERMAFNACHEDALASALDKVTSQGLFNVAAAQNHVLPNRSVTTQLAANGDITATVNMAGLDMNSRSGAEAAFARLEQAANRVCGDVTGRNLGAERAVNECREIAIANAVSTTQSTALAAVHAERSSSDVFTAATKR
ncbi:MAG: UrcA family protein [Pseudomonadota bacterium]